jgi:[ribosomal protein S5]-alanine N-acetyltransferase
MPEFVVPVVPAGRLAHRTQPEIRVDELILRPWTPADAPALVQAYSDPDIQRWHVRSMSAEEALAWASSWERRWAEESAVGWAIDLDGVLAGRMCVRRLDLDQGEGEVAYWVVPGARGRGVATRALQAVTDWMFTHVGLHRIYLEHSTRNEASCRVAVGARFLVEGTKRSAGLHLDGWHDMHLHARVNDRDAFRPEG